MGSTRGLDHANSCGADGANAFSSEAIQSLKQERAARAEPLSLTSALARPSNGHFLRGRHALKTYVCVRKSSSNAMGRLVRAKNMI